MRRVKKLIYFLVLFTPLVSQALVFVEPVGGLGYGKSEQEYTGADRVGDIKFFTFGLKAGANLGIVFGGLDFRMGIGPYTSENASTQEIIEDSSSSSLSIGLYAGAPIPIVSDIRGWVGFNFVDNFGIDSSDGTVLDYRGNSVYVGLGYDIGGSIWLNLELLFHSYDKLTKGSELQVLLPSKNDATSVITGELSVKTMAITISIPFDLF